MEEAWNRFAADAQAYGPSILVALIILAVFIVAAFVAKWLIATAIDRTSFARKANAKPEPSPTPLDPTASVSDPQRAAAGPRRTLGQNLASAAFWVIILIGIVQALTELGMTRVTDPLNTTLDQIFAYLPRIIGAILIFTIFVIVATVAGQAARALLAFVDPLPMRARLTKTTTNISGLTATIVTTVLIIVGAIAAFDALAIYSISRPATQMLNEILAIIPNAIAAAIILAIFVLIGRLVMNLLTTTLPSTGVDAAIERLGLLKGADAGLTASRIVAGTANFFIILLGLIAALQALQMPALTSAMYVVLDIAASIVFGAVIILAGVIVSRMVADAMASTGSGATDVAARVVRWIIVVLAVILGVSRMGLDPENGAFILDAARILLAGAAIALALAFGLGGREWAARQLEKWRG